jgi:hypothetical protein
MTHTYKPYGLAIPGIGEEHSLRLAVTGHVAVSMHPIAGQSKIPTKQLGSFLPERRLALVKLS